jgi:trehalose-6-phosphatase
LQCEAEYQRDQSKGDNGRVPVLKEDREDEECDDQPQHHEARVAVTRRKAQRIIDDAGLALYAGDDTTDLDAFRGLDEAGLDVALKVGVASPEVNPRLLTEADLVVDGPGELLSFLQTL